MHPITLRKATAADLQALERFQQGVVNAERPYDGALRPGAIRYYDIASMLGRADVEFVVAEAEGLPVGCAFARIDAAKPYLTHRLQAYLGLMYVEPAFRRRGVNGRIIEWLKTWCRAKEVFELRLEVYDANLAAVKAYEKAGFSKFVLEMQLSLRDESRGAR